MSTAKNRITRSVAPKSAFEDASAVVSSSVSYNQGDLLVFDATNHVLKLPAAETEGSTFLGIATETVVSGKLTRPYVTPVDASAAFSALPGPVYGVIAKVILNTGDALNPGDAVYLDPTHGAQNVTATGTKAIGIYQGALISSAAAGQEIEVLLGCRYSNDTLKF